MKQSQLRQIIREEIQKEMFGLEAYGRGGLSISKYELEKNPSRTNPNEYYTFKNIVNWPSSVKVDLGGGVFLQLIQQNDNFAVYEDPNVKFNPITLTIFKK